jgi:hypothetical protein
MRCHIPGTAADTASVSILIRSPRFSSQPAVTSSLYRRKLILKAKLEGG